MLCGLTATIFLEGSVARKVYLPHFRYLAEAEIEALEQAHMLGIPVPALLTIVYDEDGSVEEIVTSRVEGRTLDELTAKEYNRAIDYVDFYIEKALINGLVLDRDELISIKGNVRVDAYGKVWLIDLN